MPLVRATPVVMVLNSPYFYAIKRLIAPPIFLLAAIALDINYALVINLLRITILVKPYYGGL